MLIVAIGIFGSCTSALFSKLLLREHQWLPSSEPTLAPASIPTPSPASPSTPSPASPSTPSSDPQKALQANYDAVVNPEIDALLKFLLECQPLGTNCHGGYVSILGDIRTVEANVKTLKVPSCYTGPTGKDSYVRAALQELDGAFVLQVNETVNPNNWASDRSILLVVQGDADLIQARYWIPLQASTPC